MITESEARIARYLICKDKTQFSNYEQTGDCYFNLVSENVHKRRKQIVEINGVNTSGNLHETQIPDKGHK